jgi:NADH:ubiquinone oxidoreductase subunit 5 (subunit L)/multisubunit Na+/H+ antiporter MnhA subunit
MTSIREFLFNKSRVLKFIVYFLITGLSSFFLAKGYVYLILNGYIELIDASSFFLFPVFFYLFAIVISFVFKSYLSLYGVFFINLIATLVFFLYSLSIFNFFYVENKVLSICAFNWFQLAENQAVGFDLFVDYISFSFILLTITIAFFVNIYTFSYFRYEPYICRLISLINAFVLSMIILVSAGNLVVFFFG